MRAAQILTMAILVLGISGSARAQICDGALAVRINQSGLDFVVKQVQPLIPSSVAIPAVDKVVLDWPMTKDDLRVVTQAMTAIGAAMLNASGLDVVSHNCSDASSCSALPISPGTSLGVAGGIRVWTVT